MLKALLFGFGSLGTTLALGQSVSWPNPNNPQELRYTLSNETIEYANSGKETNHRWYGVRYQGLWGAVRDDRQGSRLRLNSNLATLSGVDSGDSFLRKVQVEVAYESPQLLYGLLGYEIPVYSPMTLFVASAHRPGGDQNFLGGPIFYFGTHNLQIFYYGTQVEGSKVKQSVSLRQNLRFPSFWVIGELVWRDTQDKTYDPWGYGLGVGFKHFYIRGSVSPYWDGFTQKRSSIEIGIDTH